MGNCSTCSMAEHPNGWLGAARDFASRLWGASGCVSWPFTLSAIFLKEEEPRVRVEEVARRGRTKHQ